MNDQPTAPAGIQESNIHVAKSTGFAPEVTRAAGLSLAALAISILLQGATLFWDDLPNPTVGMRCQIIGLSNSENAAGRRVAVLLLPTHDCGPRIAVGRWNLNAEAPSIRLCSPDLPPHARLGSLNDERLLVIEPGGRSVREFDSAGAEGFHFALEDSTPGIISAMASAEPGRVFLTLSDRPTAQYRLLSVDRGTSRELWRKEIFEVDCLASRPSHGDLICGGSGGEFIRVNGRTGETLQRWGQPGCGIASLDVSPDGRRLASLDVVGNVRLYDLVDECDLWSLTTSYLGRAPRFTSDGRAVVVGHPDFQHTAVVYEARSGTVLAQLGETQTVLSKILPVSPDLFLLVDGQGGFTPWYWEADGCGPRTESRGRFGVQWNKTVLAAAREL